MHDDLENRLRAYGEWLDELTDERGAHAHESRIQHGASGSHRPALSRRVRRTLTVAAAVVALVAGSIVVSAVSGKEPRTFAQQWTATPSEVSDNIRSNIETACTGDAALAGRVTGTAIIDLRGTIGLAVWKHEMSYDVCVVSMSDEMAQVRVVRVSTLHAQSGSEFSTVDINGVKATVMIFAGELLRGGLTPTECAAIDVYTNKGAVRAIEASNVWLMSVIGEPQLDSVSFHCSDGKQPLDPAIALGHPEASPTDPRQLCVDVSNVLEQTGGIPSPGSSIPMASRITPELEDKLSKLYGLSLTVQQLDMTLFEKFFEIHRVINMFNRKIATYESIPRVLRSFGEYCSAMSTKDFGVPQYTSTTAPGGSAGKNNDGDADTRITTENLSDYATNNGGRICGQVQSVLQLSGVVEYKVFPFNSGDPYSGKFYVTNVHKEGITQRLSENFDSIGRGIEKIDASDHYLYMDFMNLGSLLAGVVLDRVKIQKIEDWVEFEKDLKLVSSRFTARCVTNYWRTATSGNPVATTVPVTTTMPISVG
jgi:hypothetical protein